MGVTVVMERANVNTLGEAVKKETVYRAHQLNVWYGEHHALKISIYLFMKMKLRRSSVRLVAENLPI